MYTNLLVENLKGPTDYLGNISAGGRIILKQILER
jgi:hypothetical protein